MEATPFSPVKLICGLIASKEDVFLCGEKHLEQLYGAIDESSPIFPFSCTDYYEKEMGAGLKRKFLSFSSLIAPDILASIKQRTNQLELEIRREYRASARIINIDPGFCSASALIMATAKNFAHRIPLKDGIYAHLELLFGRKETKVLPWTYPDFFSKGYQEFFIKVRSAYLAQMRGGHTV